MSRVQRNISSGGKQYYSNVLSNLQFGKYEWTKVGFSTDTETNTNSNEFINIPIYISTDFTIVEAKITLYHSPIKWTDGVSNPSVSNWGYSRNVKAYIESNSDNYYREYYIGSEWVESNPLLTTEILNAFSSNGFTASNPSSEQKIETMTSIDIKEYLRTGKGMTIQIRSSDNIPSYAPDVPASVPLAQWECLEKTGNMKIIVDILGYI